MAGVLATQIASFRTKLAAAPASLTNVPENVSIEDPPDSDKTLFAVIAAGESEMGPEHGGGSLVPYTRAVVVQLAHFKDDDYEAFWDSIADDLENIDAVMLKDSNKTAGVVLVTKDATSSQDNGSWVRTDVRYRVRFRVAQTLI